MFSVYSVWLVINLIWVFIPGCQCISDGPRYDRHKHTHTSAHTNTHKGVEKQKNLTAFPLRFHHIKSTNQQMCTNFLSWLIAFFEVQDLIYVRGSLSISLPCLLISNRITFTVRTSRAHTHTYIIYIYFPW